MFSISSYVFGFGKSTSPVAQPNKNKSHEVRWGLRGGHFVDP
jgi:hypothetical protein